MSFESLMQFIPKSAIVVAENQIVCSIKPSKETPLLVDYSFLVLFAIYYIFYISCSPRYKQLFEFFDQNLLGKLRLSQTLLAKYFADITCMIVLFDHVLHTISVLI